MTLSRRAVLGAAAASALPCAATAADGSGALAAAIDEAAGRAIAAGACPGVAVGVTLHGRPLLMRGYGYANREAGLSVTPKSVFRIGSLTKQFTAALIVRLAYEKRLGLDDPAAQHLPAFAGARPFTLRQLLNHTAGLHSDEGEPAAGSGPRSQIQLAGEIAAQATLFDFEPGTAWIYSNANYVVLGAVVEAVTGRPLAQAAEAMIFRRLGLTATAFDTSEAVVPHRAAGYTPVEGKPGAYTPAAFIEIAEAGGAGAMRSTVGDLCRWHEALFTGRLFPARFIEMMLAPGRLNDGRVSGANRFSPDDASYGDTQYGMGLLIAPPGEGGRDVLHYGFINGFATCLESWPDRGVTLAVLCNGDVGPDTPIRAIRKAVNEEFISGAA